MKRRRYQYQPDRDQPQGVSPRQMMVPQARAATNAGKPAYLAPQTVDPVRPGVSMQGPRNNNPLQIGPRPEVTYQPQGNTMSQGIQQIQGRTPPMAQAPQPQPVPQPQPAPVPQVPPTWNGQGNVPPGVIPGQTHHWNNATGMWEQASQVPQGYDAYGRPMFGQNQVTQGATGAGVGPNGQPLSFDASTGQWFQYLPNEIQASQQGTQMQGGAITGVAPQYAQPPVGSDVQQAQPGNQDRTPPQGFPFRQAAPAQPSFRQPGTVPGYGGQPVPQTGNPPQSPQAPAHPAAGYGQPNQQQPGSDVGQAQPSAPGNQTRPPPLGIPLSPEFEAGHRALENQLSATLASLGAQADQIPAQLEFIKQRLANDQLETERQVAEAMNSRGLYGGGSHGMTRKKVEGQYGRQRQDVALSAAEQLANIARGKSQAQLDYSQDLAELMNLVASNQARDSRAPASTGKGRRNRNKNRKKRKGSGKGN